MPRFALCFAVASVTLASACPPSPPASTYSAGEGLHASGNTFSVDFGAVQRRVAGACAPGTFVTALGDGTLTCGPSSGLRQVVLVPAGGSPAENGAVLRGAVGAASSDTSRIWVLSLDAGDYDVGTQTLALGPNVDLVGATRRSTRILGQGSGSGLTGVVSQTGGASGGAYYSGQELRSLTIRCDGAVSCAALALAHANLELHDVKVETVLTAGDAYGVTGSTVGGTWRDVEVQATTNGSGALAYGVFGAETFQPSLQGVDVFGQAFGGSAVGIHLDGASFPYLNRAIASAAPGVGLQIVYGQPRVTNSLLGGSTAAISVAAGQSAFIATTQLLGARQGAGTLYCVGDYDSGLAPLGPNC